MNARAKGAGESRGIHFHTLIPPLSFLLTVTHPPLVQIYFSLQPSAAVKIKDGSYIIFHEENDIRVITRQNHASAGYGKICFIDPYQWQIERELKRGV